ncbi:hypothetical protein M2103_001838 [Ereboglobus sp. PH5-5]|uniref:hypothetical protein n=1 Tax=unclassified Ereboglobus TaxID=2626932 RepID=UPI002406D3AE|nr:MULTISPECIES: hypothetical protein [unclassified Ereboglobus]MDF9828464.1 hypothetical protein [Ereboglobus sp. PH5-10]MDF9833606.1 hypothetical protein [Ereboglobus sp. PH5-5]
MCIPAEEWRAMKADLAEIKAVLSGLAANANTNTKPLTNVIPDDAREALFAREAGKARGFFSVKEFAAAVGRHPHFISDHCKARSIKTVFGRKPYRIPFSEYEAWMRKTDEKTGPRSKLRAL